MSDLKPDRQHRDLHKSNLPVTSRKIGPVFITEGPFIVFLGSLSEVGDSWPLCGECSMATGCIVFKYSFGYVVLVYCSFTCGHFFCLAFAAFYFFLVAIRLNLLVDLVYVYRSLVYKYPPGELLQTREVLV
jgi:hypothetical protein